MGLSVKYLLLALLLLLECSGFSSCKNKEESIPSVTEEQLPKVIYQVYFVNVNNLRVRQAPNLKSTVVDKLKEGAIVYSKNEYSENKETVTLRGREITAPYYYVSGENFQDGWAFGGALVKIYQEESPSPFTTRLEEVIAKFNSLDFKDVASGEQIIKILQEYRGSDPVWNDVLVAIGDYFQSQLPPYYDLEKQLLEAISPEDYITISQNKFDYTGYPGLDLIPNRGYKLVANEGNIYAEKDGTRIVNAIRGPFSIAMNDHFRLYNNLNNLSIYTDGSIIIDLIDLVELVIAEEKFIEKYPDHIFLDFHRKKFSELKNSVLFGSDNNPAKDFATNEINPRFKEAWNYALSKYPDSRLSASVEELGIF